MLRLVPYFLKQKSGESIDSTELVNLVILALTQTGLIVATVLGSSLVCNFHDRFHIPYDSIPTCRFLVDYGVLGLSIPLIWIGWAVWALQNREAGSTIHVAVHSSGWLLNVGWILTALVVVVIPLIRGTGCSMNDVF